MCRTGATRHGFFRVGVSLPEHGADRRKPFPAGGVARAPCHTGGGGRVRAYPAALRRTRAGSRGVGLEEEEEIRRDGKCFRRFCREDPARRRHQRRRDRPGGGGGRQVQKEGSQGGQRATEVRPCQSPERAGHKQPQHRREVEKGEDQRKDEAAAGPRSWLRQSHREGGDAGRDHQLCPVPAKAGGVPSNEALDGEPKAWCQPRIACHKGCFSLSLVSFNSSHGTLVHSGDDAQTIPTRHAPERCPWHGQFRYVQNNNAVVLPRADIPDPSHTEQIIRWCGANGVSSVGHRFRGYQARSEWVSYVKFC